MSLKKLIGLMGQKTVIGQQAYTAAGTYSWTCPAGVTKISVVCVAQGADRGLYFSSPSYYKAGGGGGALAYTNNITVVPGNSYTVVVGEQDSAGVSGTNTTFNGTSCGAGFGKCPTTGTGGAGGAVINGTGGSGGAGGSDVVGSALGRTIAGGGGGGGYSGAGGRGVDTDGGNGTNGSGGGGGGGGYTLTSASLGIAGGTGINGSGGNGSVGGLDVGATAGSGGSGTGDNVAWYGGGNRATNATSAVRIIWPGDVRQFPSTRTADE